MDDRASNRSLVLSALDLIERDGIPDGFGPAKVWFLVHPSTGKLYPVKAAWGLAFGIKSSDFISHSARDKLRRLGFRVIGPDEPAAQIAVSPSELESLPPRYEGAERQVTRNLRERDPKARRDAEAHYRSKDGGRLICQGCKLDFGKTYGPRGEGFMHFHHIAPLAEADGNREVVGAIDLVPLCPNCHAMVHRGENLLTLEQLKALIAKHQT